MNICVIGTGYVGLTTAVGFTAVGNKVIIVGKNKKKIDKINKGVLIIYEPGMGKELEKCVKNKSLQATDNLEYAIKNSDIDFICVGTPSREDGSIDLSDVEKISQDIGKVLKSLNEYHVVVVKSTVVPQTTEEIVIPNLEKYSGKKAGKDFGVCMTPEFLREGVAMSDFMKPDRIVIGEYDKKSGDVLQNLYSGFDSPIMRTNLRDAEMIKYASNALLAAKISFANEIGNICKIIGIDSYEVMKGVGMDHRLGPHFLNSGCGFGGSCFPKDISAIIAKAKELDYEPILLESVMDVNKKQKVRLVDMLKKRVGNLKGKKIAILGLAFKADTDDIREAASIDIIKRLKSEGAIISAYDPKAIDNMKTLFPDIKYAKTAKDVLKGADACLVMTEWDEFKKLSENDFDFMKKRVILKGRKMLDDIKGSEGICW